MPANFSPLFVLTPNVGGATFNVAITAANTAKDGSGTVATVFTGGANGSLAYRVICKPTGTNVATVLRLFLNNGSTNATAANNIMIKEFSLPSITLTETAGQSDFEYLLNNLIIPSGYKINAVLGTAVAAGWLVAVVGGDF